MLNLNVARTLSNHGYDMPAILAAMNAAEAAGSADLDGWTIRYNDRGEMIAVHPSYCGIYIGDYSAHIIFQKSLSYTYSKYGFMQAKHRDLPAVMEKLDAAKTNGYILCECCACDFARRKKQVEKLGYTVHRSNISACESDISSCFFLVS